MTKKYWFIILTYILMQFSSFVGVPLLNATGFYKGKGTEDDIINLMLTHWSIFSFLAATLIILFLLKDDMKKRHLIRNRSSVGMTFVWGILGVFIALFAQGLSASIEIQLFGIPPGSQNTQDIVALAKTTPLFIIVVAVLGPILEEIVFRYILFGVTYKRFNFFISALVSSFVFAAVHNDFSHLLIYTSMGFVFAFLYVKTKRIIVPIIAHTLMNSLVVVVQLNLDTIMDLQQQLEKVPAFIGQFL